jgi:hypothetical protein
MTHRSIKALQHQGLQLSLEDVYRLLAVKEKTQALLECPAGCGQLATSVITSLQLDWCPDCKGIWFDGDELKSALDVWSLKQPSGDTGLLFDFTGQLVVALLS